ncbi:long-chain-fatty-acid-CoA ligase [Geomicrobium sp. JCM 19037]|uniref:class I adenylate-forming enzyme family protein n=1 Tax=Geomicrobium sp. JCM 19037 TaxID=1460634 RepID=UPI00045F1486|nr:class I adenylate-forming enzyme family protein [Geomicrobium sp. JCM 19037]GAK05370.1 long-chain-fatty-acid-CoA ligase [Geomicrobium sp. JCM 19037]
MHESRHIYDRFKQMVDIQKKKVALSYKDQQYTYEESNNIVNSLAEKMKKDWGIKEGDVLGLLMPNSIEFVFSLLAGLKLGAIIAPFNIRLSEQELRRVVEVAEPKRTLTIEEYKPFYQYFPDIEIVGSLPSLDGNSHFTEEGTSNQKNGAFLIFTSGTTGPPKGALIRHEGVLHAVRSYHECMATSDNSSTLIAVPMFHVTGLIGQLLHVLLIGGKVRIMEKFSTNKMLAELRSFQPSILFNVPTIYQMLIREINYQYTFSFVQTVAYGGAPAGEQMIHQLKMLFPNAELHNTYGATETSSPTAIMPIGRQTEYIKAVGKPISKTKLCVVDEHDKEVEIGTAGELWIKGPCVIEEYWRNDEATKKSKQNGYWKSGDYAMLDQEGYLYILDRKKDTINRGGEKIYSTQIEQILNLHDAIEESAVIGIPDELFGERVKAFVSLKYEADITEKEIVTYAKQHLAPFKFLKL